jgi:hypothetical protein
MTQTHKLLLVILLGSLSLQAQTCVAGNITACSGTQSGPDGVITGSIPSVSVKYNVSYSSKNTNEKLDIYYLTSETLTGKHRHCTEGVKFIPHPGGGNSGDKNVFSSTTLNGYSDYVLFVEKTGCPVYALNYSLNIANSTHWIQAWKDVMCGRRSVMHNIAAGTWPGQADAGFDDMSFSWGGLLNRMTESGLLTALSIAGYTEDCEVNDIYIVRSYSAQADLIDIVNSCQHTAGGGCDPTNVTTLLPVAIADQFNCQTPGDISICVATTTALHGFGWIAGEPITYVGSFPGRMYVGNGSADTLVDHTYNLDELIAAYAAAGLPPFSHALLAEGGGGHQAGLFMQFTGQTWTNLLLNTSNTGTTIIGFSNVAF